MDKQVFYFQNGSCNFLRLGNPDVFEFRIYKDLFLKSISVKVRGGGVSFYLVQSLICMFSDEVQSF